MPPGITNGAFAVTQNRTPIVQNGLASTDSQVFTGNNTTTAVPIFSITGTVLVNVLYGVVTTALQNHTAAYWRLNDATNQSDISLATGTTLTNAVVGSTIIRRPLASTALTFINASQERVQDPPAASANSFTPFILLQKTGGVTTNVEYVYTTTDTPTTGAMTFYMGWIPLTSTSSVLAL